MAVKEMSGSKAGIDFGRMIEDLTIGDTSLEMEVKRKILVEEATEIGVRVRILVEAIGGVGAVLNQEQRPVVFASRSTLSNVDTVTERECLAVVWALNKFRTYLTRLTNGKNLSSRMIRWVLKLAEFNIEWEHRSRTQNAVADVLSRNPVESIIGEKVNCAIIKDLVLSSREQLIEEQKTDPELGHIYRCLESPEDSSVNATMCDNWSRDYRQILGLLFHAKYTTSLGEMRVYIPPQSL
ncbi:retrovirus-related Pol polyprotein from transposon 297 [Trichonephila clavipes]|nr:retrovirus-related Pol polyprotein from transposon 297 [Trichonephila clavipes]